MNIHHPFKTKRPRSETGGSQPVPSLSSHTPLVDLTYNSLPFDFQLQLDQLAASYGISSGYQIHSCIQQEHTRKKRRLNQYIPMAQECGSSSFQGCPEKHSILGYHDDCHHGQPGSDSGWSEAGLQPVSSSSSPLVRRIADLSLFFCANCGFGLKQAPGYQQLPQAPPVVYGPQRPYEVEKPPSMQVPVSGPYNSSNLDSSQQNVFASIDQANLTSPPLNSFPLPDQSSLSASLANGANPGHQPIISPEYYAAHSLKQETALANQSLIFSSHALRQESLSLPYGSDLIDFTGTRPLPHPGLASATDLSHYNTASAERISGTVSGTGWNEVSLLESAGSFDILLPNQRGGKRGPFKDPTLREQTAQTRKIGSCIRCRMQRIRCETNPDEHGGTCLTCKKVGNSRAGRLPCLRYKIMDVKLYKPGQVPGFEWTRRWNNNISDPIQKWASGETKVIRISAGLSKKFVEVEVRRFVPQPGDKLERTWVHKGDKKSVKIPPYALVSLEAGKTAYSSHICDSMGDTFKSLLGPSSGLLYKTYTTALRVFKDPSTPRECVDLLSRTLKLWMSIRLSTRSCFLVGEETLGMSRNILDETSPNPGMIPVPPVLGAQLDVILIHHIQTKLRRELLDKLQKMIQKNKQNTWLVTYLVIFILLHNTSLITAHDASYAEKHGMKRRFAREDKVKEYHLGANILLAHWHYCNKGIYPFSEECTDQDLRNLADLDEERIQFVQQTRTYAGFQKQAWEDLKNKGSYEDDYFFTSQLFEENWQPRSMM